MLRRQADLLAEFERIRGRQAARRRRRRLTSLRLGAARALHALATRLETVATA